MIEYHVFQDDGAGGPVDYDTPIAIVAHPALFWIVTPAPSGPSSRTYAMRAYDTSTGLYDGNRDARTRVVLDGSGASLAGLPNAPIGLSAGPIAGGKIRVRFASNPSELENPPIGFKVWATEGESVDYDADPVVTVLATDPGMTYVVDTPALTGGQLYSIGVRSYNGSGTETNQETVLVVADSTPPGNVIGLTGSAGAGP
jgi:hypothetical protein